MRDGRRARQHALYASLTDILDRGALVLARVLGDGEAVHDYARVAAVRQRGHACGAPGAMAEGLRDALPSDGVQCGAAKRLRSAPRKARAVGDAQAKAKEGAAIRCRAGGDGVGKQDECRPAARERGSVAPTGATALCCCASRHRTLTLLLLDQTQTGGLCGRQRRQVRAPSRLDVASMRVRACVRRAAASQSGTAAAHTS